MTADRTIAQALLDIGAVLLRPTDPFEWSSGLRAPVYCDNRLTMAHPDVRRQIAHQFAGIVQQRGWEPDVIVGTATAGIPHAAWLAELLDIPMAYVRGSAKGHGRENKVEGRVKRGDRVVVVEDLISTGGSVLNVVRTLRDVGAVVVGVVAIFSYGFDEANRRLAEADVDCVTLTSFETLVAEGIDRQYVSREAAQTLERWREDPRQWSQSAAS